MKGKIIGLGKSKEVGKSAWEHRVKKRAKEAPRKANGLRMPRRK